MSNRKTRRAAAAGSDTSGPREARQALLLANEKALLASGAAHLDRGASGPFVVALASRRDPMGAELHKQLEEAGQGTAEELVIVVVNREGFGALLDAFHSEVAAHFHENPEATFAAVVAHGGVVLQSLTTFAPRSPSPWGAN